LFVTELIRAVVDTNVWISAFINPHGAPARLLARFALGHFLLVTSPYLLGEAADVLGRIRIRRAIRRTEDEMVQLLVMLRERSDIVYPSGSLRACRDPKDDLVLGTAMVGRAHYLVSRDDDIKRDEALIAALAEQGVEVVSVARMLAFLDAAGMAHGG
jgi:uncharacterized protein